MKNVSRVVVVIVAWLLAVSPNNRAFAQKWNWEKLTLPAPYDRGFYLDVMFLPQNPRYGWACGFRGMVVRTTDGGITWEGTTIPNADQLESIIFINERVGYCSGTNNGNPNLGGIYRSIDGGRSWTEITPILLVNGVLQRAPVWGCYFLTETIGMVVGGGCAGTPQMFFRTTDGGQSWEVFFANAPETGMSHVLMYDVNGLCYASSGGRIWQSFDGGRTWEIFAVTGPPFWQENLAHRGTTFLVGTAGNTCTGSTGNIGDIRWSIDGGRTWSLMQTGASIFGTYLLNENVGWVAGWNRAVYRFTKYTTPSVRVDLTAYRCGLEPGSNFDDIWFVNDTLGYVVGDGIYRTTQRDLLEPIIISNTGQFVLCDGQAITLSVIKGDRIRQPYNQYLWSTGQTTPTITVTKAGIYWVEVRDSDACFGKASTVEVTEAPAPRAEVRIYGPIPVCEGDTIHAEVLLDSSQVKIVGYQWTKFTTSVPRLHIVAHAGDVLEFQVVVRGINGCEALSNKVVIPVRIRPRPSITVRPLLVDRGDGSLVLCPGEEVVLEAPTGYDSYRWSTGQTTRVITVRQAGRYTVTVTANEQDPIYSNCEGTSQAVVITISDTVKPRILSNGALRICEGDWITLFTDQSYVQYRWSTGETSSRITVSEAGKYWVHVTDRYNCSGYSDTVVVDVDPNPISIVGIGGTVFRFDTTSALAMRCDSIRIRNESTQTLVIASTRLKRNIEFSVPLAQLPVVVPPGQERWIVACFLPSILGVQRDTLTVSDATDYCKRRLELIGVCAGNSYGSLAGCGVNISGQTLSFQHSGLVIVPPYPQPATNEIRFAVNASVMHAELISAFNHERVQCITQSKNSGITEGTCTTSTVASGYYVLTIDTPRTVLLLPVIVFH